MKNTSKSLYCLIFMKLYVVYGMEDPTIQLRLQSSDGTFDEQVWNRTDFDKITVFKNLSADLPRTEGKSHETFLYTTQDHVTHAYLKNLITGNFINQGLTYYINDYNFFIGNDIQLPADTGYEPFSTSLKWKVFKDNENFFRINIKHGPKELQDKLKTFLCRGLITQKEDYSELFTITQINLTLRNPAQKLSLVSPFIIDFKMFETIDESARNSITWLDLSNSATSDLDLSTLLKYFPNLHKLTAKNTLIARISQDDIDTLKAMRDKEIIQEATPNPWPFFDTEGQMDMYALAHLRDQNPELTKKQLQSIEKYSNEINWHSFVLDLRGCSIENSKDFLELQNKESNKTYKKSILIKGVLVDQDTLFEKILLQFLKVKKQFLLRLIFAITCSFLTGLLLRYITNGIKGRLPAMTLLKVAVFLTQLSLFLYLLFNDLYKEACLIDNTGVNFR